jgi:von Willebrand factor type A domain
MKLDLTTLARRTVIASALLAAATSSVACAGNDRADQAALAEGACVDCDNTLFDGGNGATPDVTDDVCGTIEGSFQSVTPTVVLLIDQSGSMSEGYGDEERWHALYDALMDPSDGVVKELEGDVRFGLTLYTSHDGGETCPELTEVEVAIDNFASIDASYAAASYQDDTPTGESLAQTAAQLAALELDGPKAIIVATDGEPDTCAKPDPNTGDNLVEARAMSVAAAEDAFDQGIQTYMLSVGSDIADEHLQAMADAGAGASPGGAAFYRPASKAELVEDIRRIVETERSCVFTIDGNVDVEALEEAVIVVDGVAISYGTHWKLRDANHIEILGEACEALMSGDHDVEGTFYCPQSTSDDMPTIK